MTKYGFGTTVGPSFDDGAPGSVSLSTRSGLFCKSTPINESEKENHV
jgi:hypothetical protein